VPLSRSAGNPSNICGLRRGLLPYQVASSSIQPFGHIVLRRMPLYYYLVVEMHTLTIRSDDKKSKVK